MTYFIRSALLTGLFVFYTNTSASAIRCGTSVISEGTEEFTVNLKCGKPLDYQWVTLPPWGVVKKSIYDMGKRKLTQIIIFSDGKVVDIRNGPRR